MILSEAEKKFCVYSADAWEIINKRAFAGEAYGELPVPYKDGYYFTGWYTEKTGGEEVTNETIIASDITLYAHWELATPHTLSTVTKSGTKLTVDTKVYNISDAYDILIACYKNNKFVTMKRVSRDEQNSPYTLEGDIDEVRVMVIDALSTLKPLCEAEKISSIEWLTE